MWKKVALVILVSITFLLLAESIADYFMKRYPKLKSSYISQVDQKADILIIGACEAEMMLDPKMFDSATGYKTYNLGEVGTRFADNYLYLFQSFFLPFFFLVFPPHTHKLNFNHVLRPKIRLLNITITIMC